MFCSDLHRATGVNEFMGLYGTGLSGSYGSAGIVLSKGTMLLGAFGIAAYAKKDQLMDLILPPVEKALAEKVRDFFLDNQYQIFGSGLTPALGTAFLAGLATATAMCSPLIYERFKVKPPVDEDKIIKQMFAKLHIKEWSLPGLSSNGIAATNSVKKPVPQFNSEIQNEINVIKERMEKSCDRPGNCPLPNLIFEGKPGVGKTMLMENLCHQSGIGFIRIPSGAMESHLKVGTHIHALQEIFDVAMKCAKPVYIIMDDGEQLVAQRPLENKHIVKDDTKAEWIVDKEKMTETIAQRRIALVNAILEESGKDVRQLGFAITTNRLDVVDKAFKTRTHVISINPPGKEERKRIIITHLSSIFNNDINLLAFFNKGVLENMAVKTEGFTGRNLVKMLEDLHACIQIEDNITDEMIDAAIVSVQLSNQTHHAADVDSKRSK